MPKILVIKKNIKNNRDISKFRNVSSVTSYVKKLSRLTIRNSVSFIVFYKDYKNKKEHKFAIYGGTINRTSFYYTNSYE